jgi:hypothetical protein
LTFNSPIHDLNDVAPSSSGAYYTNATAELPTSAKAEFAPNAESVGEGGVSSDAGIYI